MAMRPVFLSGFRGNLCCPTTVEFTYFNGFSKAQRMRSSNSLHEAFLKAYPDRKVLEISSFCPISLGNELSAFHLMLTLKNGQQVSVECAYQAGKIFTHGGPYQDLLTAASIDAKKDPRLKNSGTVTGFYYDGNYFQTSPRSFFYNWLYLSALVQNPNLGDALMEYDAFTDIVFNPDKASNCQAEACAYYVALRKMNLLADAMKSPEDFLRIAYKRDFDPGLYKKTFGQTIAAPASARQTLQTAPLKKTAPAAAAPHTDKPFQTSFKIGDKIEHPKFGLGEVKEIEKHDSSARLTIAFSTDTKTLDEKWILEKCSRL